MKKPSNKQAKKASKLAKAENLKKRANKVITVKNAEGDPDTTAEIVIQNKISYEPKVSVIIPVYNVEQYLRECLDSVVNQTLKEIEIICVDDGSTDSSLEILKEYANRDNRITVISRENRGVGYSRNQGIKQANGEFIAFMDPDDYYPAYNILETIYEKAKINKVEICGGSLIVFDENQRKEIKKTGFFNKFNKNEIINYNAFQYDYGFQRYIYNTKFIKTNNIYFPNYRRFQDPPFMAMAMSKAKYFYAVEDYVYGYRWSHKSINWTEEKVYHLLQGLRDVLQISLDNKLQKLYDSALVRIISEYKKIIADFKSDRIDSIKNEIMEICINNAHNRYKFDKFKPKVSVILPIYNASEYLEECLDSVVYQTLKDIEIICVNDGSTDNSLDIIKEYAKKDKRIKYIDKPNAGYGQTMNVGMDLAKGEYIGIVEPDDFIKLDMYETLYNKAKENDVEFVKSSLICYWKNKPSVTSILTNETTLYNKVINLKDYPNVIEAIMNNVTGIYQREFLRKYQIRFNETPGASYQDNSFYIQVHFLAKRFYFIKDAFYYYRQDNENSSCNSKEKAYCIFKEYELNEKIFKKYPELKSDFISFFNYKKLKSYHFHYTRIDSKHKLEFLKIVYDEFLKSEKNKEINWSIINAYQKKFLEAVLSDYKKYHNDNILKTKEKMQNIKEQNKDVREVSPLKSYLLLPYYLLKIQQMKRAMNKSKPSRVFSVNRYGNKKVYRILGFKFAFNNIKKDVIDNQEKIIKMLNDLTIRQKKLEQECKELRAQLKR